MDYITITLAFSLIVAYALLSYFQLKKLKGKTLQVIEGKIENKQLNKLINKARALSKNRFAVYMCFQGLLINTSITIVFIVMDLLNKSNELDIFKYLIFFLIVSIVFTLTGISKANSIWQQVDNMENK